MAGMCWEDNPRCFVKGQRPGGTACPCYNENRGCWQVDWSFIISSMPDAEKGRWKDIMKNECPSCPVFAGHKEELGIMIRLVLEL